MFPVAALSLGHIQPFFRASAHGEHSSFVMVKVYLLLLTSMKLEGTTDASFKPTAGNAPGSLSDTARVGHMSQVRPQ